MVTWRSSGLLVLLLVVVLTVFVGIVALVMSAASASYADGVATAEAIFVGIGIGTIVWQVRVEHKRRAGEMTIQMLNEIRGLDRETSAKVRSLKIELNGEYNESDISKIKENEVVSLAVKQMLSRFEHFAVGVNEGVYSRDITGKVSTEYLLNEYNKWRVWMAAARRCGHGGNRIYSDFEKLVTDLANHRKWTTPESIDEAISKLSMVN